MFSCLGKWVKVNQETPWKQTQSGLKLLNNFKKLLKQFTNDF